MSHLFCCVNRREQRGFTLTERAIVLGVIGTILGVIWTASATVGEKKKIQQATQQTLTIVDGYKSLWGIKGIDAAEGLSVTCLGVHNGIFPKNMLQEGVACTDNSTTLGFPADGFPVSPWSNQTQVNAYVNENTIAVIYYGLDQAGCTGLLDALTLAPNITYEAYANTGDPINGQWLPPVPAGAGNTPWTTTQISGFCANVSTNSIMVGFPIK